MPSEVAGIYECSVCECEMPDRFSVSEAFAPVDELTDQVSRQIVEAGETNGRSKQRNGRVKTRFLKFSFKEQMDINDEEPEQICARELPTDQAPIGWLVIVDGAGRGETFPLLSDAVHIGRGDDQDIQLAFGDKSISRQSHARLTYYGPGKGFILIDGHKPNPVLLNGRTLHGEARLENGDLVRIGETTLRLMC